MENSHHREENSLRPTPRWQRWLRGLHARRYRPRTWPKSMARQNGASLFLKVTDHLDDPVAGPLAVLSRPNFCIR